MLINLRNALMAGKRLPYDAEVEYLESTGTQWINTGVVSSGIDIKCTMAFTDNTVANQGVFGSRARSGDTGSNAYQIWYNIATDKLRLDWASYTKSATVALNTPVDIEAYQNGSVFVNGTEYTGSTKTANAYNFYIFNFNQGGTPGATGCRARLYSFKLWRDGVLVGDYIPVRVGNVGYLYDRVSGKLFGNAGTGDFQYGQDVVPVEYIESHGTEWIDTGVIGNSSTKVELKAQGTNTSALQVLCGARDSNGLYGFAVWQRSTLLGAYGMRWDYLATNTVAGDGYVLDGVWNTSQPNLVVKDEANNYLNGVQLGANASASFSCNFPLALFAMNTGGSKGSFFVGKMFMCKISSNNTPTRNYAPVRVGTEGAMMDVLTRRIYRNAGTGAFTYGNDLKYPIPAS